ncbi:agmatine deiminase [Crossiella equi]|uniref:Agmatine deiminase n=1 Tax=Crossiella equi TaxID=130796 RepID=A0ABS5ALC5_9PSEU|nr:agmatine deiminase family protein [Crossiella equi]MBP2477231.1 agmatine deiminase [Crossiella equi]
MPPNWTMPAESDPHARTYLAWPAHTSIHGRYLGEVRDAVARIVCAVAEHEPVTLLARPEQAAEAARAVGGAAEVLPVPVDDLWVRDHGPVFVTRSGEVAGVDFGFNGWGGKQDPHGDDHLAARRLLAQLGLPRHAAGIVAEGGSLEVDGEGTLLATESSLLNDNRNRGLDRAAVEAELGARLGVEKVVWLAGVRGADVTDCHVDALARFAAPGVVFVNEPAPGSSADVWAGVAAQAREALAEAVDARGRRLVVVPLPEPDLGLIRGHGEFVASYLNYYVANGAVFAPQFGDRRADDRARGLLAEHHPDRVVVQLDIDPIAYSGGGIHCATQQRPGVAA